MMKSLITLVPLFEAFFTNSAISGLVFTAPPGNSAGI